jgi:hypothetical protein
MKIIATTLLSTLVLFSTINAGNFPLSPQSRNHVALVTLGAGLISGGLGYMAHQWKYPNQEQSNDHTFMGKLKALPWKWILIPAAAGASLFGYFSFINTPEKVTEWGINKWDLLKQNDLFEEAAKNAGTNISELKSFAVNTDYQATDSRKELQSMYNDMQSLRSNLVEVTNSGYEGLRAPAQEILKEIKQTEGNIRKAITALNPECAIEANAILRKEVLAQQLENQKKLVEARMKEAAAKQTKAEAAVISAVKPQQPNPAVIVNNNNG